MWIFFGLETQKADPTHYDGMAVEPDSATVTVSLRQSPRVQRLLKLELPPLKGEVMVWQAQQRSEILPGLMHFRESHRQFRYVAGFSYLESYENVFGLKNLQIWYNRNSLLIKTLFERCADWQPKKNWRSTGFSVFFSFSFSSFLFFFF